MSHILANNGDRKLMLVSISMFSGSKKPTRINIICQSLVVFQNGCHFNKCCNYINILQNNYMFLFVVSAVVYSYEAPFHHFEYYNTISHAHMQHKRSVSLTTTTLSTALSESKCALYSSRTELSND